MSYRTYINGHEWLGNNEMYDEIYQELVRQGCPFDKDSCVVEPFEVKDLDGLVKACEKVIIRLVQQNKETANFNHSIKRVLSLKINLTHHFLILQDSAYIFIGVNLLNYIGEYYKDWTTYLKQEGDNLVEKFKLTEKGKCLFSAY